MFSSLNDAESVEFEWDIKRDGPLKDYVMNGNSKKIINHVGRLSKFYEYDLSREKWNQASSSRV